MQELFLKYRHSTICYRRFGEGPRYLLCFHGYGEQASAFDFLENHIGSQYTVFAIDLPFHGKTEWKEGLDINKSDLLSLADACMGEPNRRFSLMGFSLGGRIALSVFEAASHRVEQLVLLASDGLKVNFWYWLATQTWMGNRFFALTMKKPGWFMGMLKLMNRMHLINASIFKFVDHYIGNKEVREQLYTRWTAFRKIKSTRKNLRTLIQQHQTPVHLVYGKHDRIILPNGGKKLQKGIEEYCSLDIIASGHQVLHGKHAIDILKPLKGHNLD